MLQQMDSIFDDFKSKIATLDKQADVLSLKASVIGKKGSLAEILKSLKDATPEQRAAAADWVQPAPEDYLRVSRARPRGDGGAA